MAAWVLLASCGTRGSECTSSADCASHEECVSGGGIFVGGGLCVPGNYLDRSVDVHQLPDAITSQTDDAEGPMCNYRGLAAGVCVDATRTTDGECEKPEDYQSPTRRERCDEKDNDCDGERDEGCRCDPEETEECYTGPSGTADTGKCKPGTRRCTTESTWGSCSGEVTPDPDEICDNGVDDDCNGATDENCPCRYDGGTDGVCATAKTDDRGRCRRPSSYVASTEDETPHCEGKDNDCDGDTDEGCTCSDGETMPCGTDTGVCERGRRTCQSGAWSSCQNAVQPMKEQCGDNRDTDCDGSLHKGCPCNYDGVSNGVCGSATYDGNDQCQRPSDYVSSEDQKCADNKDNDCDGQTDEATRDGGATCSSDCQCFSGQCFFGRCAHRLFVTRSRYDGDLGGLSGADQKCRAAVSNAGGLQGTWKAILSTNANAAKNRISLTGRIEDMTGTLISTRSNFWTTMHSASITTDATGSNIVTCASCGVWTGTNTDGTPETEDCLNWRSGSSLRQGSIGDAGDVSDWVEVSSGPQQCSQQFRLYCIDGQ